MRKRKKNNQKQVVMGGIIIAILALALLLFYTAPDKDLFGKAIGEACDDGKYKIDNCVGNACDTALFCINNEWIRCTGQECKAFAIVIQNNMRTSTLNILEGLISSTDDTWFLRINIETTQAPDPQFITVDNPDTLAPVQFDSCDPGVPGKYECEYRFDYRNDPTVTIRPGVKDLQIIMKDALGNLLGFTNVQVTVEDPEGAFVGADVVWQGTMTGTDKCTTSGFAGCTESFDAEAYLLTDCDTPSSGGFAKCDADPRPRVDWSNDGIGTLKCLEAGYAGCEAAFLEDGAVITPITCTTNTQFGEDAFALCSEENTFILPSPDGFYGSNICINIQHSLCLRAYDQQGTEITCDDTPVGRTALWAVCSTELLPSGVNAFWNPGTTGVWQFPTGEWQCPFKSIGGTECVTAYDVNLNPQSCTTVLTEGFAECRIKADEFRKTMTDPDPVLNGVIECEKQNALCTEVQTGNTIEEQCVAGRPLPSLCNRVYTNDRGVTSCLEEFSTAQEVMVMCRVDPYPSTPLSQTSSEVCGGTSCRDSDNNFRAVNVPTETRSGYCVEGQERSYDTGNCMFRAGGYDCPSNVRLTDEERLTCQWSGGYRIECPGNIESLVNNPDCIAAYPVYVCSDDENAFTDYCISWVRTIEGEFVGGRRFFCSAQEKEVDSCIHRDGKSFIKERKCTADTRQKIFDEDGNCIFACNKRIDYSEIECPFGCRNGRCLIENER